MPCSAILLQPNGRIRYLNTAGFAIRRSKVSEDGNLFNPIAVRAEDTLLLSTLVRLGELPIFVSNAVVQHRITMSLAACLRKDVRSAYLERRAFDIIEARGVAIQMTNQDRWAIMSSMWQATDEAALGKLPWFVVTGRPSAAFAGVYRLPHIALIRPVYDLQAVRVLLHKRDTLAYKKPNLRKNTSGPANWKVRDAHQGLKS